MDKDMKRREDLISTLLEIKNKEEMLNFLEGILTPKELQEIPMRLQIVRMLKKGVPQHQIAEALNIGIATVTRGSKEIQRERFKYIQ